MFVPAGTPHFVENITSTVKNNDSRKRKSCLQYLRHDVHSDFYCSTRLFKLAISANYVDHTNIDLVLESDKYIQMIF